VPPPALQTLPAWIPWILVALIGLSVLYEFATGRARVRGFGVYTRRDRPGAYWTALLVKTLLIGVVLVIHYVRTRS
jgi:hypothetical protein